MRQAARLALLFACFLYILDTSQRRPPKGVIMQRLNEYEAHKWAMDYDLFGDSFHLFLELMAGRPVNVVTLELPGEVNFKPERFTITPKHDLGLHYYEVTKPPAARPIRQPVLALHEVANWVNCLACDNSV